MQIKIINVPAEPLISDNLIFLFSVDFKEKFRLVEEEKITTDNAGNVTGKVVFVYALGDGDKRIDIGFKTYRSKAGAAGKTNNTMAYSTSMQNCFKTGEKP